MGSTRFLVTEEGKMFWFGILVGILLTLFFERVGPVVWARLAKLIGRN